MVYLWVYGGWCYDNTVRTANTHDMTCPRACGKNRHDSYIWFSERWYILLNYNRKTDFEARRSENSYNLWCTWSDNRHTFKINENSNFFCILTTVYTELSVWSRERDTGDTSETTVWNSVKLMLLPIKTGSKHGTFSVRFVQCWSTVCEAEAKLGSSSVNVSCSLVVYRTRVVLTDVKLHLLMSFWAVLFNPFIPEFSIVIIIHYKPRIAVAILDL